MLQLTEDRFGRRIPPSGRDLRGLLLVAILVPFLLDSAYGHGVGSEAFPPRELDGKLVTLEITSSKSDPESADSQQIAITLIDFDSKEALKDVTFHIRSELGDEFLFEQEFRADNGFIVFNFVSEGADSVTVSEDQDRNIFNTILGIESKRVNVKGPDLSKGGLYKFDITVLGTGGYSDVLEDPLVYNARISIPQTSRHDFVDPNFGKQHIQVITYYNEISDFHYDSNSRKISYSMPFEWTADNINQTSVIHEEFAVSKEFGDLLVSGFTMSVNGIDLSSDVVIIDDFTGDDRIVHFTIYQTELLRVFESGQDEDVMDFVIRPDLDYPHMSSVTSNGEFRITVFWEPKDLRSGSNVRIMFDITDIFLKNRPVATEYEFSATQNSRIIFEQNGTSTDSREEHNVAEFVIPEDVTGIIQLNFENLNNNRFARSVIPVVVDRVVDMAIPDWIRDGARQWSKQQTDDDVFIQGIRHLIDGGIVQASQPTESQSIPSWFQNSAGWWAEGAIDDESFVSMLEFLIKEEIIRI